MFRKAALYQKHPQNATLNSGALPHERDPRNACYNFFPITNSAVEPEFRCLRKVFTLIQKSCVVMILSRIA